MGARPERARSPARVYVRVHEYDTRRTSPTVLDDAHGREGSRPRPRRADDPGPVLVPHTSPDLRVHPKLGRRWPRRASLPWTQAKPKGAANDPFGEWKLWRFQTALRNVDRRSEPSGTWDAEFDAVLRANGVPTPGGKATIDKPFWQSIVKAPNLARTPWDTALPTEADLAEFLPTETTTLTVDAPSVVVPLGTVTAEVLVHHRGFPAAPAGDVQVTLLVHLVPKWVTKKGSVDWLPGAVGWTTAVATLLQNGTNPALPAGWRLADTATPRRQPVADVAAGAPQAVSFDVDLGTVANGTLVLLAAIVHSANDHVTMAEAPIDQLTRTSPHVAVRSVVVRT